MKTINEHVSLIEEWLSGYKPNDDFAIPREAILSFMNTARSALIRQDSKNVDSSMYQRIDCLELHRGTTECVIDGYTLTTEQDYFYVDLPDLVSGVGENDIAYLGTADLQHKANRKSIDGIISMKWNKYTSNMFSFVVMDKKAFIFNIPDCGVKALSGMMLLSNPMDIGNWDSIYPCTSDHRLFVLTTQLISSAYGIRGDEWNNARSDTGAAGGQQQQKQTADE